MTQHSPPWSLNEDRLLVRMLDGGVDRVLICQTLDRPEAGVACRIRRLKEWGLVKNNMRRGRYWSAVAGYEDWLRVYHARQKLGMGYRRRWTKELFDKLADDFNAGMGPKEIAAKWGMTAPSIQHKLGQLREEGEIGRIRSKWTHEQLGELWGMFYGGMGDAQIAVKLGRSANSVLSKRKELGFKRDNQGFPLLA